MHASSPADAPLALLASSQTSQSSSAPSQTSPPNPLRSRPRTALLFSRSPSHTPPQHVSSTKHTPPNHSTPSRHSASRATRRAAECALLGTSDLLLAAASISSSCSITNNVAVDCFRPTWPIMQLEMLRSIPTTTQGTRSRTSMINPIVLRAIRTIETRVGPRLSSLLLPAGKTIFDPTINQHMTKPLATILRALTTVHRKGLRHKSTDSIDFGVYSQLLALIEHNVFRTHVLLTSDLRHQGRLQTQQQQKPPPQRINTISRRRIVLDDEWDAGKENINTQVDGTCLSGDTSKQTTSRSSSKPRLVASPFLLSGNTTDVNPTSSNGSNSNQPPFRPKVTAELQVRIVQRLHDDQSKVLTNGIIGSAMRLRSYGGNTKHESRNTTMVNEDDFHNVMSDHQRAFNNPLSIEYDGQVCDFHWFLCSKRPDSKCDVEQTEVDLHHFKDESLEHVEETHLIVGIRQMRGSVFHLAAPSYKKESWDFLSPNGSKRPGLQDQKEDVISFRSAENFARTLGSNEDDPSNDLYGGAGDLDPYRFVSGDSVGLYGCTPLPRNCIAATLGLDIPLNFRKCPVVLSALVIREEPCIV